MGVGISSRVIEFRLDEATPNLADALGVEEGSKIFFARRVRMIDGRPLAVLVNYLPYEIGARIPVGELAERPLIDLIEERAGVVVEWASEVFQAVGADDEISQLLEVDMLTPLLKVTLTVYSAKGTVVNLADVFYRCDRYNHRGFVTRDHRSRAGFWRAWAGVGGGPEVPHNGGSTREADA